MFVTVVGSINASPIFFSVQTTTQLSDFNPNEVMFELFIALKAYSI